MITKKQLKEKRQEVDHKCNVFGFRSAEHLKAFNEFYELNNLYIEQQCQKEGKSLTLNTNVVYH